MRRLTRQMGKESYFMGKTKSFTDIYSKVVTSHSNDVYDPTFVHRELEGAAVDEEAAKPATAVQDCASTIGRMNVRQVFCCKTTEKLNRTPLYVASSHLFRSSCLFFLLQGCSAVAQGGVWVV